MQRRTTVSRLGERGNVAQYCRTKEEKLDKLEALRKEYREAGSDIDRKIIEIRGKALRRSLGEDMIVIEKKML